LRTHTDEILFLSQTNSGLLMWKNIVASNLAKIGQKCKRCRERQAEFKETGSHAQ